MPEWVQQLIGVAGGAVVAYGAIRSDLAYVRAKAEDAHDSAKKAHARIDSFFDRRGKA